MWGAAPGEGARGGSDGPSAKEEVTDESVVKREVQAEDTADASTHKVSVGCVLLGDERRACTCCYLFSVSAIGFLGGLVAW